jgi:tetratricopeptide (TPR) repeat protein
LAVSKYSEGLKEFERLQVKLKVLMDEDPTAAIAEAHSLASQTPDGVDLTGLKAAIFVDAGAIISDRQVIGEGIQLFKTMLQIRPADGGLHYNIGNGLVALADQEPYASFDWYLQTAETRREGRGYLRRALTLDKCAKVGSMSLTNLGNAFWKAHRWAEAYDAYSNALMQDTTNAVASTGAVKVLLRCAKCGIGDRKVLFAVAARHLQNARQHPHRIRELAGLQAYNELLKLLQEDMDGGDPPDLSRATDYERFVAKHRLTLCPTIEGLDVSLKRWDSLRIESVSEPVQTEHGVPPLFAMFNVMKSDFLIARYIAYIALSDGIPDSGFYADTLDYAMYGTVPSMLSLAQRACMDVLDKIAVATSEYCGIPNSERTTFTSRWFVPTKKGQPLAWDPSLSGRISKGNTALIALAEVSLDLHEGGALSEKKAYRNSSTHRFTVLHDIACKPSRKSDHVEHCKSDEFEAHLIESLQLARAALLYFVEMVSIEEHRAPGNRMPIFVPSHHSIRGDEDEVPDISDATTEMT